MNSIRIIVVFAWTALLTLPNTLAMSDQLKEFQRAFDAAKYELQGIKSSFSAEDEKLLRQRRRSIDELLANFQTDLNMANVAENTDDSNGSEYDTDGDGDIVGDGDGGQINEWSNSAFRPRNCNNGRCGSNCINNNFLQKKTPSTRMLMAMEGSGNVGKPKKRVDLTKELNEVAKLNKIYKNPNRPFRPMYGPNGMFDFGENKVVYPNKPLISSSYNTAFNVMNKSSDNFRENGNNRLNNNNNNDNGNSNYRNNSNNNKDNNGNNNNQNNNNNNRYNSESRNNHQQFANNRNNKNQENNYRNGNDNSYCNRDNNNDNPFSNSDFSGGDTRGYSVKQLTIYSNKPRTGSSSNNNNGNNNNDNSNFNDNNYASTDNNNNYDDNNNSGNKVNDNNNSGNKVEDNNNNMSNEYDNNNMNNKNKQQYNLDNYDSTSNDYIKSIIGSPTIYDSLKYKKAPNVVDLLPQATYDETIAHIAFPTIEELSPKPVASSNDQTDVAKNDLSHEANYKLSKIEQDASEACKMCKNWDGWKTKSLQLTKRHSFSPLDEIKLKTSARLMERGFGASLPSATLEDMQRARKLDDIVRRLENQNSRYDQKPNDFYSDVNKWNLLLAKEMGDNQVSLMHGFDSTTSHSLPRISDDKLSVYHSKWEPLLSRVSDDDEYHGLIKARLKRLIDLHNSNAHGTTENVDDADAAEAENVENMHSSEGTTRTKRISEGLDPKVISAILQLQRDVNRNNRMKRFIGEELVQMTNLTQELALSESVSDKHKNEVKAEDKKTSPGRTVEAKVKEPMLSIMAKDFINDKVLAEEKKDEKVKTADDAAKVENMIAPVATGQEQTKNRVEHISEKDNKESSRNAKASEATADDSKRVKRSIEVLKSSYSQSRKLQFFSSFDNKAKGYTDKPVTIDKKGSNQKRTKRSLNVADEIFCEPLNQDLESGDSPAHKRLKRDLKSKDTQPSSIEEVPANTLNRSRHKRTKRSVMEILPGIIAKNSTLLRKVFKTENPNDTANKSTTADTKAHKLQKRATSIDDDYNDNNNDNIGRYTSDSHKALADNDIFGSKTKHGKRAHLGLKKNRLLSFDDLPVTSYNQPQFDNLKEREYSKLNGVKFDNMWYEKSNNKLNDFRNLLMENKLNNNLLRYHDKLRNNLVDESTLAKHNLTVGPLTSILLHETEEFKPEPPRNQTDVISPTDSELPPSQIDIAVPIIVNEANEANTSSTPVVLNDADRNLILQLRDQVLNCTAFAQLENLLKGFEGRVTSAPLVANISQTNTDTPAASPTPNVPATNKVPTETAAATATAPPAQPETEVAAALPKSMSVTMSFDKKGGLMTINQKKPDQPDDKVSQLKDAHLKSGDTEPAAADAESSKKDEMLKLNITISANVIGDQKSNNFYGNGTINVQPGSEDRNRRNVIFPDLGPFDKYEEYDEFGKQTRDEQHVKKECTKHKECKTKSHKHKTKSKSKSNCKGKDKGNTIKSEHEKEHNKKPPAKEKEKGKEKGKEIGKDSKDECKKKPKKKGKGKSKPKVKEDKEELKPTTKPNKEEEKECDEGLANQQPSNPALDNIASGKVSSQVVQSVFSMVSSNPRLRPLLSALKKPGPQPHKDKQNFSAIRNKCTESKIADAEKLLKKAMTALNEVIDQQLRSRTCIPLRPNLAIFYEQILKSYGEQEKTRLKREATKRSLATDFSKKVRAIDPNKVEERSRIVKKLLKQYEDLPQQDQEQVSGLRDDLLMDLVYLRKVKQSHDMQERRKREILKQEETQAKKIDADIMKKLERDYSPSFLKLLKTAELFKEAAADTEVV